MPPVNVTSGHVTSRHDFSLCLNGRSRYHVVRDVT